MGSEPPFGPSKPSLRERIQALKWERFSLSCRARICRRPSLQGAGSPLAFFKSDRAPAQVANDSPFASPSDAAQQSPSGPTTKLRVKVILPLSKCLDISSLAASRIPPFAGAVVVRNRLRCSYRSKMFLMRSLPIQLYLSLHGHSHSCAAAKLARSQFASAVFGGL